MIRIIYWILVVVEIILLLAVMFLFIVTDSRTIKLIANTALDSTEIRYESIEGNLFKGLEVNGLSYEKKPIFRTATIHWNPLSLFNHKISITQLDAKGVELENIIAMIKGMKHSSSGEIKLDFITELKRVDLEINPYLFEGVKFSSLAFKLEQFRVDKSLSFDADSVNLKFDSDLVNVALKGEVKESRLLLDEAELKEISSVAISKLVKRLGQKYASSKQKSSTTTTKVPVIFKEIQIKHLLATLKPVTYGVLQLQQAKVELKDAEVNPYNGYDYRAKDAKLRGETNFGFVDLDGFIKSSNIYAKGEVKLTKRLFSQYRLPLNVKALKSLPIKLRLNHSAVWVDVNHSVKKLLALKKSGFNVDISKAEHRLAYPYGKDLTIKSSIDGNITYAKEVALQSRITIGKKGFSYEGEYQLNKSQNLPDIISQYLLPSAKGTFRGDTKGLKVKMDSKLLDGNFTTNYKKAVVSLKSRAKDIILDRLIAGVPSSIKEERVGIKAEANLDFFETKNSKVALNIYSNLADVEVETLLSKTEPYRFDFIANIPKNTALKRLNSKIKFTHLKQIKGEVILDKSELKLKALNRYFLLNLSYGLKTNILNRVALNLEGEEIELKRDKDGRVFFATNIPNIHTFLEKLSLYYAMELPNISGEINLEVAELSKGEYFFRLKSPNIKYLSDKGVKLSIFNLYNIKTEFIVDSNFNITLKKYRFNIDNNPYMSHFFSNKSSYISFKNSKVYLKKLWINDEVLLKGAYDTRAEKGEFSIIADRFAYKNRELDLLLGLNLKAKIDKSKYDLSGDIDIFGNSLYYELSKGDLVEDADIIIVQDMLEKKESPLKNLKLFIKVKSKKPLRFRGEDVDVEFFNDLTIVKSYNQDIFVTGMSTITKGYYQLEDKRFTLDESHIYFAGDAKKPLLDIKANYEKEQYNIHIFISGTTDEPIVNFNSDPYLTQQEILSLILFDGTGSNNGRGAEAYTILGGTFAKGLMKSLGINVDHLLLGSDENDELSLEIGRKVSKNVTILYLHKNGLDGAKVRVEHGKSFETDIIIQPPNTSSIEFLYKRDR